jgi:alanyl-tRNA synthetase
MRKEIKAVEGARVAAGQQMVSGGDCDIALLMLTMVQIQDELSRYFNENPNENVYVGVLDVGGDTKILAAATAVARALGKAAYVFSADATTGRVTHANYLPPHVLGNKCLDAKRWLAEVTTVLGGKVSYCGSPI